MLGRTRFPAIGELPYMITLAPYGFYWFQLQERDKSQPVPPRAVPEFETLVVPLNATWVSLARDRGVFERDVLPGHLARTRWYPERSAKAIQPTLISAIPFCDIGDNRPWLAFFETTQRGVTTRYVLPLQIEWVRFDRERYNPRALAAVRQGAREGTLLDVATDQIFIALLLRNLAAVARRRGRANRACGWNSGRPAASPIGRSGSPNVSAAVDTEQSNSTALVDDDYVVKIYRKLEAGINPEIEMGRFLTEVAGFANTPALLGSVELVEGDRRSAIGVVHAFVAQPGRRLDRDGGLSRSLCRRAAAAGGERTSRHKRGTSSLPALYVADRTARRRNAYRARQPQGPSRLCAGADAARGRAALDRTISWRAPNACSTR